MKQYIILIFGVIIGISFSVYMIYRGTRLPIEYPVLFEPPSSPYISYVAGEGTIESYGDNIYLGVSYSDLVMEVPLQVGSQVKKGDILFKIDTRQAETDLIHARAQYGVAKTEYQRATQQFLYYQKLKHCSAVSQQEYTQAYYAQKKAYAEMQVALAEIARIKMIIERAYIRAPADGQLLQDNIHPGVFANQNPFDNKALMIFGNTKQLQLRVNIAEEDSWRIIPGAPGMAFVRGNSEIKIPLTFDYIEPIIVEKRSLSGSDTERIDTRVLQIVYRFEKGSAPVYVGQLLDVYLEAKPSRRT